MTIYFGINCCHINKNRTMKKIILISAFLVSRMIIDAQNENPTRVASETRKDQTENPETKAKINTEKMTEKLGLSADQQAKVQVINLENAKALKANREKYVKEDEQLEIEKRKIFDKWNSDLTSVFNAEQLKTWEAFVAEKKADKNKAKPSPKIAEHTN